MAYLKHESGRAVWFSCDSLSQSGWGWTGREIPEAAVCTQGMSAGALWREKKPLRVTQWICITSIKSQHVCQRATTEYRVMLCCRICFFFWFYSTSDTQSYCKSQKPTTSTLSDRHSLAYSKTYGGAVFCVFFCHRLPLWLTTDVIFFSPRRHWST